MTSYVSITAPTVKLYTNLNSGKGLGRIFAVILTLGSAWSYKKRLRMFAKTEIEKQIFICYCTPFISNLFLPLLKTIFTDKSITVPNKL